MLAAFFLISARVPHWLMTYGYLIYFPLTVIEGPIVTVVAGFFVSLGYFNFIIIYLLAIAGDLAGDMMYYAVGRWGRERIIRRGRFLHIRADQLERIRTYFQKHAGRTLLFGKWTHSAGGVILVSAGMGRLPVKTFLFYNFIGTVPKSLAFLLIGYYFGRAYREIDRYFDYAAVAVFIMIAVLLVAYLVARHFRQSTK